MISLEQQRIIKTEMHRSQPFTEVIEDTRYNHTNEKVIADARAGKHLTHTTDHADLMEKLRSPL